MPAQPSNYWTILQAALGACTALALRDWNSVSLPFAVRKLPMVQERLDSVPAGFIVPSTTPEQVEMWSSEWEYKVSYYCDVVVVSPGNLDPSTHLDYLLNWRERLRLAVLNATYPVGVFYNSFLQMDPPIDRTALSSLYDYGAFRLFVEAIELRKS